VTSERRAQTPVDVVILEADPAQRRTLSRLIADRAGGRFLAHGYASRRDAVAAMEAMPDAVVVADLDTVGGMGGLADIARRTPRVIAASASASLNLAVAAVRAGAGDFLPKPIGAPALIERLEAAIAGWGGGAGPPARSHTDGADFAGFIGRSPAMKEVYAQIRRVAPSRAPVFITGESGTGKELCAEAIHRHAGPDKRPFIAINCSAIPRELMESEIFGHMKGAFTGASEDRSGAAELAHGGTLFLDEIAEMELPLQAKLLRFLQTGSFRRVGGAELRTVAVRILSATNRDPLAEVEAGRFRADLFYRLHVLPIHLAPLRERREDIIPLAECFLARFSAEEGRAFRGFDEEAAQCLLACDWPGNVRQLENAIRQVVVLHGGEVVTKAMLPAGLRRQTATPAGSTVPPPPQKPLWAQERAIIEEAIAAHGGSIARAAAALEISPSTIYRKRESWARRRLVPAAAA
jgi:two-component system repressor protein LuxO